MKAKKDIVNYLEITKNGPDFPVARTIKNLLKCGRPRFDPRLGRIPGGGHG